MTQSIQKAKMTNSTILKANNATNFGIKPSSNSSVAQIVIIVIAGLGILILLENFLILVASVRNRKLRDNIQYNLVLSLSVSDFLLGVNILLFSLCTWTAR